MISGEENCQLSPEQLLNLWHDYSDIPINDLDEIEDPVSPFPCRNLPFRCVALV